MEVSEEQLRRVLDSRAFAYAPRLRKLLCQLADGGGFVSSTHEADMGRLAARLTTYYAGEGQFDPTRISVQGLKVSIEEQEPPVCPPIPLAVLPVISQTPEYNFLADGLTDDWIHALSSISQFRVVGRNSAFSYRNQRRDVRQIAAQLSVAYVVEAVLQVGEGRIQIAWQLMDAGNGAILWEEHLDQPLAQLIRVRNEILAAITDVLRVEAVHDRMLSAGTANVNAYLDSLRGRHALAVRTPDSLKVCQLYFRSALDQHSDFAGPHSGLAECFLIQAVNDLASAREVMPQAKVAAERALEIDQTDARPRAILGAIHAVYDWNWAESATNLEQALKEAPGDAQIHQLNAIARLVPQGRWEEAFESMDLARKLDPAAAVLTRDLGLMHFLHRDYSAALVELRKVRELPGAEYWLGRLFIELRRFQEALDLLEPAGDVSHRALSAVAYCFARMGRKSQAEQVMRQIRDVSRKSRVTALDFAHPLIGLGRIDEAFAYLRQSVAERTSNLIYFSADPIYDPLRKDPRSQTIRGELGLAG